MKTAREILFKYYKIWHKSIFKESPEQDMYEQFIESSSTYAEKAMEEYLILGQIKVLEEIDKAMGKSLFTERPSKNVTMEEVIELWEGTIWHKTLLNKIQELKAKLK